LSKAKVAVLHTSPETVLADYNRLLELAEVRRTLDPQATTILKDNISWHYPMPSANTTPWQLEGTILALRQAGYNDLVCVQNQTLVVSAFKGEDLNHYVPIFRHYHIPVLYNFKTEDMKWVPYRPKAKMLALDQIYPEGIHLPDYFFGKNIVHLPTVKCVSGDTEVIMADGSVIPIRDLVEKQLAGVPHATLDSDGDSKVESQADLLAWDEAGNIGTHTATVFWRTSARGRRILRLRTRTGRTLTATADHLIRTPSGWTAISTLTTGTRVAIARKLKVAGISQPLPRTYAAPEAVSVVARAGRKYSAACSQQMIDDYQAGDTAIAIAERHGVRWQVVQSILRRHGVPVRGCANQLRIPETTSPDFWRWFGYVIAEGNLERGKTCDKLWWANSDPILRQDFIQLTEALFGLEARERREGESAYLYSTNLGRFFEELGLPVPLKSGNKRVPELLFRCPDEEIAAFLSGYLDGDGTVNKKQTTLSATTKSPQLAHDLQILFGRLGVVAFCQSVERTIPGRWKEPRTYYQVTVSGEGLAQLASQLQLKKQEKRERLERQAERFLASKPSNWDVVPLPTDTFRAVRMGLGFTQASTGKPASVNSIEGGYQSPTPRIARYFVNLFTQHDIEGRFAAGIAQLRALASGDLAWDVVESIEDVTDEGIDLYDVTVPSAGSFLGNGLVLHNCHIYTTTTGAMKNAFGGLLATHRHYTHTWIHETLVDLLAIQKEIHPGIFAVMDGTTAGNGPGPRTMTPVVKNVILASADQVAIDAVAAKLMGFDPLSIGYIRLAHEHGLGVGDPREIELVGDDVSGENWGFQVGQSFHRFLGWLSWYGPTRVLQKLIFRTPIVIIPQLVSEVNHDYIHWPLKEKHIFERWRRETPWGQLFQRYERFGESGDR